MLRNATDLKVLQDTHIVCIHLVGVGMTFCLCCSISKHSKKIPVDFSQKFYFFMVFKTQWQHEYNFLLRWNKAGSVSYIFPEWNILTFFWVLSMDVSRTVLLSTTEGKKVERFINVVCFEEGSTAQLGERGTVFLGIYQSNSCCSRISFSMKEKRKDALCRGCCQNWFYFAFLIGRITLVGV